MDLICVTSKYHSKLSVGILKSKSRGQGNVKMKISGLGGVIYCFRSVFVKNAKEDPRTLFERPKSDKVFKNGENLKSQEISL